MTTGSKLFKVNLAGESGESLITNSQRLASLVSEAECRTCEEVEAAVEEDVKGTNGARDFKVFEQHMKEEENVRINSMSGQYEKSAVECGTCGDRNVWDRTHRWQPGTM